MGRQPALDEDALHKYLYERSDRFHRYRLHQQQLSIDLMIDKESLAHTLRRMEDDGRLRLIKRDVKNMRIYYVTNPEGEDEPADVNRSVMWQ